MVTPEAMLNAMDETDAKFMPQMKDAIAAAVDIYISQVRSTSMFHPLPLAARRTLISVMTDIWNDAAERAVDLMMKEFKDAFTALESKTEHQSQVFDSVNRYISRYGGRRAAQVIDTTERQIENLIKGGLSSGQAASEVYAKLTERVLDLADIRGEVITRTESHAMNQFASYLMAGRSSIPLIKTWNSFKDDRTRRFGMLGRQDAFNHLIMDKEKTALDQFFAVPRRAGGFEHLLFPGDPNGSAGNVINCRCTQTYERAI